MDEQPDCFLISLMHNPRLEIGKLCT